MDEVWAELGIGPVDDRRAVRRAYAARLKTIRDDAEAFKKLRSAYEAALYDIDRREWEKADAETSASAQGVSQEEVDSVADVPVSPLIEAPAAAPSQPDPQLAELWRSIDRCLEDGRPLQAMTLCDRGLAQGLVPLGAREMIIERIMSAAVEDQSIAPQVFVDLVQRAGWGHVSGQLTFWSPVRDRCVARADAEAWYLDVERRARQPYLPPLGELRNPFRWLKGLMRRVSSRTNAHVFRDGIFPFFRLTRASAEDFRRLIVEYRHFEPWLSHRIPPSRVKLAEGMAALSPKAGVALRYVLYGVIIVACVGIAISGRSPGAIFAIWLFVGLLQILRQRV